MAMLTVGFAGMTHLGTCSAVAASIKGNNVVAFDFNNNLIKDRLEGRFDKAEPRVDEFLIKLPDNFLLTNKIEDLKKCDLVFISVDTPVDSNGTLNILLVEEYYFEVAKILDPNIPIIILSQVRPGLTASISQVREEVYYQMETLIFGLGLERALKPERFVIGLKDETKDINSKYKDYLGQFNCQILRMSLESAELAKLSANFFLASTITATNTLASLSAKLGANWNQIAEALKMDRRIGPYAYLKPGLGIGGSNIKRDLIGIREMSNHHATESSFVDAMLINSQYSQNWIIRLLNEIIQSIESPKIGILGLSYKQNTSSIIGSTGVRVAEIYSKFLNVLVYDPAVKQAPTLREPSLWADSAVELISAADILIISTECDEFKSDLIKNSILNSNIKNLVDPFGCQISVVIESSNLKYFTLGRPAMIGNR